MDLTDFNLNLNSHQGVCTKKNPTNISDLLDFWDMDNKTLKSHNGFFEGRAIQTGQKKCCRISQTKRSNDGKIASGANITQYPINVILSLFVVKE